MTGERADHRRRRHRGAGAVPRPRAHRRRPPRAAAEAAPAVHERGVPEPRVPGDALGLSERVGADDRPRAGAWTSIATCPGHGFIEAPRRRARSWWRSRRRVKAVIAEARRLHALDLSRRRRGRRRPTGARTPTWYPGRSAGADRRPARIYDETRREAEVTSQSDAHHAHHPVPTYVATVLWLAALVCSSAPGGSAGTPTTPASCCWRSRCCRSSASAAGTSSTLQDRIIQLEMQVRCARVLPAGQDELLAQLSPKQVVALRFAVRRRTGRPAGARRARADDARRHQEGGQAVAARLPAHVTRRPPRHAACRRFPPPDLAALTDAQRARRDDATRPGVAAPCRPTCWRGCRARSLRRPGRAPRRVRPLRDVVAGRGGRSWRSWSWRGTGRAPYEWAVHAGEARPAGVAADVIDDDRRRPGAAGARRARRRRPRLRA